MRSPHLSRCVFMLASLALALALSSCEFTSDSIRVENHTD